MKRLSIWIVTIALVLGMVAPAVSIKSEQAMADTEGTQSVDENPLSAADEVRAFHSVDDSPIVAEDELRLFTSKSGGYYKNQVFLVLQPSVASGEIEDIIEVVEGSQNDSIRSEDQGIIVIVEIPDYLTIKEACEILNTDTRVKAASQHSFKVEYVSAEAESLAEESH